MQIILNDICLESFIGMVSLHLYQRCYKVTNVVPFEHAKRCSISSDDDKSGIKGNPMVGGVINISFNLEKYSINLKTKKSFEEAFF